jgi:hypothetical protein
MTDLIQKALIATRESKHVEFKQEFDTTAPGEWCELVKDIAAIANSGGGIIVFGLDSAGIPAGVSVDNIRSIDPADIGNKLAKYTGPVDLEFEFRSLEKEGRPLVGLLIQPVSIPLVFQKPGTYDIGGGKQRTAFGVGTIYFRHGAKSEPGTTEDIRRVVERQLERIRKDWVKGVRRVVQAPPGSQIVAVHAPGRGRAAVSLPPRVHVVNDPSAIPIRLTRDPNLATGSFVHEEVSDGIFDEINNVVDANRVLAKGQKEFLLGQPIYYRIYAERHHVKQSDETIALLLDSGITSFYAPALFWALSLPDKFTVQIMTKIYLYPTNRHVHYLIRIGLLLGPDFCQWLYGKWHEKWKRYTQPPSFYFTFKSILDEKMTSDPRLLAARTSSVKRLLLKGEAIPTAQELLENREKASLLLSKACMLVFEGDSNARATARSLDYLANGAAFQARAPQIAKEIIKAVGERRAGDVIDEPDPK